MNKITIWNDVAANCWMSETITNDFPDADMVKHLGTHILPTAFTTQAEGAYVAKRLEELNPGYQVMIRIKLA
jgi:hypothetical protein